MVLRRRMRLPLVYSCIIIMSVIVLVFVLRIGRGEQELRHSKTIANASEEEREGEDSVESEEIPEEAQLAGTGGLKANEEKGNDHSDNDLIYIYRAYYDNRTGPGRLRILAMSKCMQTGSNLTFIHRNISRSLKYFGVEGSCPRAWVPNCVWNAYMFESTAFELGDDVEITLLFSDARQQNSTRHRNISISVVALAEATNRVQVCVPPVYWYDDWPRLLLFAELYKRQNATLLLYINSVTDAVEKILNHYEKEGTVKVVNWPLLPSEWDEDDPNIKVYRLAHTLANNDCVLRSDAKYAMLSDIDEYVHATNMSLFDLAESYLTNSTRLGSISFEHHELALHPPLDEHFEGVREAAVYKMKTYPKTLFMPSRVLLPSTHNVRQHVKGFKAKKISDTEAVLLHNRVVFDVSGGFRTWRDAGEVYRRGVPFAVPNLPFGEDLYNRLVELTSEIFGDEIPHQNPRVYTTLKDCLKKWFSEGGCKDAVGRCFSSLLPLDKWVFHGPSTDSHYESF